MSEKTWNNDFLECPHCGYVDQESWELSPEIEDEGTTECGKCEKKFKWRKFCTFTYEGIPLS